MRETEFEFYTYTYFLIKFQTLPAEGFFWIWILSFWDPELVLSVLWKNQADLCQAGREMFKQ